MIDVPDQRLYFVFLGLSSEQHFREKIGKKLNDIHTDEKNNYEDEFWK